MTLKFFLFEIVEARCPYINRDLLKKTWRICVYVCAQLFVVVPSSAFIFYFFLFVVVDFEVVVVVVVIVVVVFH